MSIVTRLPLAPLLRAYPVAALYDEIPFDRLALIGRKRGGEMFWSYTLFGGDLRRFETAFEAGDVIKTQRACPGEAGERDYVLLAQRVRKR